MSDTNSSSRFESLSTKGQTRAYRKQLRKIGLRNFPLSGAFHVRTSSGGILLPSEVSEYGDKGLVLKSGAKPYWKQQTRELTWTNSSSGCYSAADGLSIERVNTKYFVLSRDGEKLFKGRLKECQQEALKLLDSDKSDVKQSA